MTFSKTTGNKKLTSFGSIIDFGKYSGHSIKEIYKMDASYLLWAIENTDRFYLSDTDELLISEKAEKEEKEYHRATWDIGDGYDWHD